MPIEYIKTDQKNRYRSSYIVGKNLYNDSNLLSNGLNSYNFHYNDPLNQIYATQGNYSHLCKITNKGVTNDSFTIVNNSLDFDTGLSLRVIANNKLNLHDNTAVMLLLSLNNKSIQNLPTMTVNESIAVGTRLYLIIYGDSIDIEEGAIISFDVDNEHNLTNPILVNGGRLISTPISESDETLHDLSLKTGVDPLSTNNFPYTYEDDYDSLTRKRWASSLDRIFAENYDAGIFSELDSEDGYTIDFHTSISLDSSAHITRSHAVLEDMLSVDQNNQAVLSIIFSLANDSFSISGGSGYAVGDFFTVTGDIADGRIIVDEVDENGGILFTSVDSNARGSFSRSTTLPTIADNSPQGNGASIQSNDLFIIRKIVIDNPGVAYSENDVISVYNNTTETFYDEYTLPGFTILTTIVGVEPVLNNNFSLSGFAVLEPGFRHDDKPLLELIDLKNKQKLDNIYVTSNANNFIENNDE